eukprot:scaffold6088_cov140-Skeletonema_dohrnii-CCMP3373.AAC.4
MASTEMDSKMASTEMDMKVWMQQVHHPFIPQGAGGMFTCHLTMCDENVDNLFLINLQHLEIRLGGIVYATTSNDEVEGHDVIILDNDCNDGNNDSSPKRSRNVMIPIQSGGGCRNATIQIDIVDMPEPPWKMLKSAISYNQNQSEYVFGELIDVFDIMISSRQLPLRLPEQVAELVGISFDTSSVRSMLSCLRDDEKN